MRRLTKLGSNAIYARLFPADCKSHFDGMVSTSNHLVPGEDVVYVKTTKPLLWTVELRVDKIVC